MGTNGRATGLREKAGRGRLDTRRVRRDFPVLRARNGENPLVYLDSASTAQKPKVVIDRVRQFYAAEYAKNDTPYRLGRHATAAYEHTRSAVAKFINAPGPDNIVFTRNTTEAINIVSDGFAWEFLERGDAVVISALEHHSVVVPFLMACERTGARLKVARLDANGDIDVEHLKSLLTDRTKLVAVAEVSNVLGGRQPVEEVVRVAHRKHVPVLVDGAQAAPHVPVDVRLMGCDFYAFSGHKAYGPSGIGLLYGTREWLDKLPPPLGGEPMAEDVSFDSWSPKPPPEKFSAGVPAIGSTVAFADALAYLSHLGMRRVAAHVRGLAAAAADALSGVEGVQVIGTPKDRVSVVSFTIGGVEPERAAEFLDRSAAVAVRAGHLSCRPLMKELGISGAVRASFGVYNTPAEIDVLVEAVRRCGRRNR